MRGAGQVEAIILMEHVIQHVATEFGMDPKKFREINFYKTGDITPCQNIIHNAEVLKQVWHEAMHSSEYEKRLHEVKNFNAAHRWKKRAISLMPSHYCIGIPGFRTFFKGQALVSLNYDGTAILYHGGVEMGQGLHTKLAQICAGELKIPISHVYTAPLSEMVLPNCAPTGGSEGVDTFGPAIINACKTLNDRLAPLRAQLPDKSFVEILQVAGQTGITLTAHSGFVSDPWNKPGENIYKYENWGAVATEIELDLLTGEFVVISCHCVQDVGQSLNPAVDIGQVEGGYVMGLGWLTVEDVEACYLADGTLKMDAESYPIAVLKSIPQRFHVALTAGVENAKSPFSSKGIGEPPMVLSMGAVLALQQALVEVRTQHGLSSHIQFDLPATKARIQSLLPNFVDKKKKEEQNPDQQG